MSTFDQHVALVRDLYVVREEMDALREKEERLVRKLKESVVALAVGYRKPIPVKTTPGLGPSTSSRVRDVLSAATKPMRTPEIWNAIFSAPTDSQKKAVRSSLMWEVKSGRATKLSPGLYSRPVSFAT